MPIYSRDEVLPEWEGVPWPLGDQEADLQEAEFHIRAQKPLAWTKLDWSSFPPEGIFGADKSWFADHDVEYVAQSDSEELILIRNLWFGFPDPPEWGLAVRSSRLSGTVWSHLGYFSYLPEHWVVPGEEDSRRLKAR